jgi:hypothetical protein
MYITPCTVFVSKRKKTGNKMAQRSTILLVTVATLYQLCIVNGLATCRISKFSPVAGLCQGVALTNNYCIGETNLFSSAQSADWISAKQKLLESFTTETCRSDITKSCSTLASNSSVVVIYRPSYFLIWNYFHKDVVNQKFSKILNSDFISNWLDVHPSYVNCFKILRRPFADSGQTLNEIPR